MVYVWDFLLIHLFSESCTVEYAYFAVASNLGIWWEYRGRLRKEGYCAKSESFNRTMWAAWRANKAWHDRSVYLFCRELRHYFPTAVPLSSYLFRRVHTSQQRWRSVARGVTLYNRGWLPFDMPLYGTFNTSLIEIGFRGRYVEHCEMYLIFPLFLGKTSFTKVFKSLARYGSENNFIRIVM